MVGVDEVISARMLDIVGDDSAFFEEIKQLFISLWVLDEDDISLKVASKENRSGFDHI